MPVAGAGLLFKGGASRFNRPTLANAEPAKKAMGSHSLRQRGFDSAH